MRAATARAGQRYCRRRSAPTATPQTFATTVSICTLEDDVRRCLVRVFPYSILYTVEPDFILIVAVMHGKRQLGYRRYRLGFGREMARE